MYRIAAATRAVLLALAVLVLVDERAFGNHAALELLSVGPAGGQANVHSQYAGASSDGKRVFFTTTEQLVASDTDSLSDVYERFGSTTTLVSTGPLDAGNVAATFVAAAASGTRVFFQTSSPLTADDVDTTVDVYERVGGTTELLASGTGGAGTCPLASCSVKFGAVLANGTRYFSTTQQLTPGDTDSKDDAFAKSPGGALTLVSTGPGDTGNADGTFAGATPSGSHVFFTSLSALVGGDVDGYQDVYERSGGATALISAGPSFNGPYFAEFAGVSPDGSRVFFTTREPMFPADDDVCFYEDVGQELTRPCIDIFERHGGSTDWVSHGSVDVEGPDDFWDFQYYDDSVFGDPSQFGAVTTDGSIAFFSHPTTLTSDPNDDGCGIDQNEGFITYCDFQAYQRTGGAVSVVSGQDYSAFCFPENPCEVGRFLKSTGSGAKVLFSSLPQTFGPLVVERSGGTYTDRGSGTFGGASDGLERVFFTTNARLTSDDTDDRVDIYENFNNTNRLLSGPNGNNIQDATYHANSSDGTRMFFSTAESPLPQDQDPAFDVYVAKVLPEDYPRPGGGTPLRVPLVPAFAQCTAPNSEHVAPLAEPSCSPPAQESGVLTTSALGQGTGRVRLDTIVGSTATFADEADLQISVTISDVRCSGPAAAGCTAAGGDYAGKVLFDSPIRVTDRSNAADVSGTVQDARLSAPFDCVPTSDPATGSTCSVATTADALQPGFVRESRRTVIGALSAAILDAGPNGSGYGAGCPPSCGDGDEAPFMRQGVFTP